MKLLSEWQLGQIDEHLRLVLDRIFSAEGVGPLNEVIRSYVLAGGKRIRPQLCVWTYQRIQGSGLRVQEEGIKAFLDPGPLTLDPQLLDLSCAWELFHAFLLAHDDIIDNSDMRRGQASLHRRLAALDGNTRAFGVNLGIVAGDLLFSAAMRLWHELVLPGDVYRDELKLFSRIATTTGFGQAIDICQSHADLRELNEELLLREYHWKTAAYTFEGPMLAGAILARVSEGALRAISRFALALGQAYQLQNDLLDLSHPVREGSDLVQGKRTIALVRARAGMSDSRRGEFDRMLGELQHADGETIELAEGLRQELRACGAIDRTRELIGEFLVEAKLAANDPAMPAGLSAAMSGLIESLNSQYFLPVEAPSP